MIFLIFFIVACGGEEKPSTVNQKDKICKTYPNAVECLDSSNEIDCEATPKPEDCLSPSRSSSCSEIKKNTACVNGNLVETDEYIINALLESASDKTPLTNYLLRPYGFAANSAPLTFIETKGDGIDIKDYKIGGFNYLSERTVFIPSAYFASSDFKTGTKNEIGNKSRYNVVQIRADTTTNASTLTTNYYYSHIDKKQFVYFLPSLNKLEVLILNSKGTENKPSVYHFRSMVTGVGKYSEFKTTLKALKGFSFKGFALARFISDPLPVLAASRRVVERFLYPADFEMTFNSTFDPNDLASDNHISMTIKFKQQPTHITVAAYKSPEYADKPALDTIQLSNLNLIKSESVAISSLGGKSETNWLVSSTFLGGSIAISHDNQQVAGLFQLSRDVFNQGKEFIQIVYASNEKCLTSDPQCLQTN